jgi:hypothetical protein
MKKTKIYIYTFIIAFCLMNCLKTISCDSNNHIATPNSINGTLIEY